MDVVMYKRQEPEFDLPSGLSIPITFATGR